MIGTIEVRHCDFCVSKEIAKTCDHCNKDACSNCAEFYNLNAHSQLMFAYPPERHIFSAFICNDCAKNELPAQMLRFGFYRSDGTQDTASGGA